MVAAVRLSLFDFELHATHGDGRSVDDNTRRHPQRISLMRARRL
jgi:hypothetical protein